MNEPSCKNDRFIALKGREFFMVTGGMCYCHCESFGYLGATSSFQRCVSFCHLNGDIAVECSSKPLIARITDLSKQLVGQETSSQW